MLIDEVDVFFSKDFYGNIYTPLARLRDPTITNLTNFIWTNRNSSKMSIRTLEKTSQFTACCARYPGWEGLVREAAKDMLADLCDFKHDYLVHHDKIAYKEQDGISFDVVYGYKTLFAYYHEHERQNVSKASLDANIFIGIRCGSFSYAEIPKRFQFILGVTGTLQTLSGAEKKVSLFNTYKNIFLTHKENFITHYTGKGE